MTLTGAGGSGKTRLALEVARRLQDEFSGGAWFVPLADLSDPRLMGDAIRDALHLSRASDVEPFEQVVAVLSQRPSLLVLDNVEHLARDERLGRGVRTLLESAPSLTCLVTSRQRLNLMGEREFPVLPLPTPASEYSHIRPNEVWDVFPYSSNDLTAQAREHANARTREYVPYPVWAMTFESVQLFIDRAQTVSPDFQMTAANAAAVAELCNRLEGIPLAIELAAARAQVLTPTQMLAHLKHRFDFLVSQWRDVPERHLSLRAAIDASYHLLTPELQRVFVCLSVFRGGWTLEAAGAVCFAEDTRIQGRKDANGDSPSASLHPCVPASDPLDLLAQLRECSLILSEEHGQEMRYRMLEMLREYAAMQLSDDERAELSRRHAHYFLRLAERAEPELSGPHEAAWFERLEAEYDNLRAALEWCHADLLYTPPCEGGDGRGAEVGLRLSAALVLFWEVRGHLSEGREHLAAALSRVPASPPSRERAKALYAAGVLAYSQNDYPSARAFQEASLAISRQLGDMKSVTLSLTRLGLMAYDQGDVILAKELHEEALTIRRELGDQRGMATSLSSLGFVALRQGDFALARSRFQESLALLREMGHAEGIANSLNGLGQVAWKQGHYAQASDLLKESLMTFVQIGYRKRIAGQLVQLGGLSAEQGQAERAARLMGAVAALGKALGLSLHPDQQAKREVFLTTLRETLGEPAFTAAYEAGRALSLEQAVACALNDTAE